MLGEGARTQKDADTYFESYKQALSYLLNSETKDTGLSIKLSALHPRYEFAQKEKCIPILTERLLELCHMAVGSKIRLTMDAEEADRLDLSLTIFEAVCLDETIRSWVQETHGLGLAIQAYQKRAVYLIKDVIEFSKFQNCPLHIRLVKGAYWDTEIKHAQVEGYPDYPVFTRKANTDLSFLTCAQLMLKNRAFVYPMFGTHNAALWPQ